MLLLSGCFGSDDDSARTPFHGGGQVAAGEPEDVSSWDDARDVWADFERLRGWTVAADGAEVALHRVFDAREQRYAACLVSTQTTAIARVWLRPPQPIDITEPFDAIEMDVRADPVSNAVPVAARPRAAVILEDAEGRARREPLGEIPSGRWRLAHRPVTAPPGDAVRLRAIEVSGWRQPHGETIRISRLAAYLAHRGPIQADWLPSPRGRYHSPGWHVLHGDPPDTPPVLPIAPASGAAAWQSRLVSLGNDRFEFRLQKEGLDIRYAVAVDDPWRGLTAVCNGREVARWTGVRAVRPAGAGWGAWVSARAEADQSLRLDYANGLVCRIRMEPPWLALRFDEPGGRVERFEAGAWIVPGEPQRVVLPLLGAPGGEAPAIWQWSIPAEGGPQPLFGCVWLSPWESGASALEYPSPAAPASGPAAAAVYAPDTGGRRAAFHEDVYLGVSPEIEDVLPRSPAGRGFAGSNLKQRLWSDAAAADGSAPDKRCDVAWSILGIAARSVVPTPPPDDPEQFGILTGDAIAPSHPGWSRDVLRLDSQGQWIAGGRADAVRMKIPVLAAWHRIALDSPLSPNWPRRAVAIHTPLADRPPWAYTDFDARTPEAGCFLGAFRALGRMFREVSAKGGSPVLGSSAHAWLYAGWLDGWTPDAAAGLLSPGAPAQPLYALRVLQPAGVGIGLGPAGAWLSGGAPETKEERLYRWLALHLAYGCALRIPDPGADPAAALRAAALLRGIQGRTLHEAPVAIAWSDGARLESPSQALADGLWKEGRLYLRYPRGLELWVHAGRGADWTVSVGPDQWRLPPSGWIASDGVCLALSARVGVNRIDLVHGPDYLYVDGHGQETVIRGLACAQPALIRSPRDGSDSVMVVVFPAAVSRIGFDLESGPRARRPLGGQCWRKDGRETARPRWYVEEENARLWLEPPPDAGWMRVEWGA